jgi:hypothetical protein
LSITGSDGRKISFTYTAVNGLQRVYTVSDRTRTWTYDYTAAGDLETVTPRQPLGKPLRRRVSFFPGGQKLHKIHHLGHAAGRQPVQHS